MYSIRVEGDVDKLLRKMSGIAGMDKKGLNHVLGEVVKSSTVDRFRTNKAPSGKKWTESIRAKTEGGVTLVRQGNLKKSIHYRAGEDGFAVGTNTVYAATHQLGDDGRRNIPARPFLGLSEDDERELKGTADDFINEL